MINIVNTLNVTTICPNVATTYTQLMNRLILCTDVVLPNREEAIKTPQHSVN